MAYRIPCILPGLVLILACAAVSGCNSEAVDAPVTPAPSVVETAQVTSEPFSEQIEVVGQLSAAESVLIRSEVAGVVESVLFEEGTEVGKGRVLFVLHSEEQQAALRFAEANLVLAADIYQRTKKLSKVQISAISELTQAGARVAAAEAAVDLARVALTRTRIRAPFDGALGARWVSPGARIDPDVDLVQLDAVDGLVLHFSLPENAISLAHKGLRVTARVNGLAGEQSESVDAVVYFVSPSLDPSSRRLALKAWVPNETRRLRPGVFARVTLQADRGQHALFLPEASIAYDARGSYVWRISRDQTVERVGVELGTRRAGQVVIRSGLAADDTVVTGGTHKLFGGETVAARGPDVALAD